MIWAKEETVSREEIKEIQTARLRETVERVYHTVEPYRKKMDEAGPVSYTHLDVYKRQALHLSRHRFRMQETRSVI